MIRGTTPTFKLILNSSVVDLTEAANVYATFTQNLVNITKSGESLDILPQEVDVYLTQEETLRFSVGMLETQLNWTYDNGKRACTNIVKVNVGRNLVGEVLE